jgi:hypothetical protein
MTLQEFRDEVESILPDSFGWAFYTFDTPDDEYLCAKGVFWRGLKVRITHCEYLRCPYEVNIADIFHHHGTSLKEAFEKAASALSSVAAKMLEVARDS